MLVGYMRVSKADGSQMVELQRDALLAAGVDADHLYEDRASGRRDDRPGLTACRGGRPQRVWSALAGGGRDEPVSLDGLKFTEPPCACPCRG